MEIPLQKPSDEIKWQRIPKNTREPTVVTKPIKHQGRMSAHSLQILDSPLILYANVCWLDLSQVLINKIQNNLNQALKICRLETNMLQNQKSSFKKPLYHRSEKCGQN